MHPSERIKHIKAIASALSNEEWSLLDLILKQFGLPWTDQWGGSTKEGYVYTISRLLGHRHISTTGRYFHLISPQFRPRAPDGA